MSKEEDLSIETDITQDYQKHKFLDLNKPLLMQLWNSSFSKDFYLEQIHRPRHYRGGESAPLFGNFLEPLSKTAWYVVPTIWLPCVAYGTIIGFSGMPNISVGTAYWMLGLFLWSLIEYIMHRFLFHVDTYESQKIPCIMMGYTNILPGSSRTIELGLLCISSCTASITTCPWINIDL